MGKVASEIQTGTGHALVPLVDAGINIAAASEENGSTTVEALQPVNYAVVASLLAGIATHAFFGLTERALPAYLKRPETQNKVARVAMTAAGALGAMIDNGNNLVQGVLGGLVGALHSKVTTSIVPRFRASSPAPVKSHK